MKDSYYFQHDYNSRNDDKILELRAEYGAAGYGIYWMIVESLAETDKGYLSRDRIGGLSLGFGIPKDELVKVLDFCIKVELFCEKDGQFYSERMLEHKKVRQQAKENGIKGAKKRWGDSPPNSPPNADPNAKERKEKERKEKERKEPPTPSKIGRQHIENLAKEHGLDLDYVKVQTNLAKEYYEEKDRELTPAKLDAWLSKDSQSKKNPSNPNRITPPYHKRLN